jgi:hypothetical protein
MTALTVLQPGAVGRIHSESTLDSKFLLDFALEFALAANLV